MTLQEKKREKFVLWQQYLYSGAQRTEGKKDKDNSPKKSEVGGVEKNFFFRNFEEKPSKKSKVKGGRLVRSENRDG